MNDMSIIIAGDTLPKKKPDPLPLLHAASTFEVDPGQSLMIGDSESDVKAARAADFQIICAGLFDKAYTSFMDTYSKNICAMSVCYPGVREGIDFLKEEEIKLSCVTNKSGQFVEPIAGEARSDE